MVCLPRYKAHSGVTSRCSGGRDVEGRSEVGSNRISSKSDK